MIFNPCGIAIQYDFPHANQHVDGVEECNGGVPYGKGTGDLSVNPRKWEPKGGDKYSAPDNV